MNDCIFCKIVRNEIPNVAVYEDDVVKAFLDIHTLIVPKKHVPDIFAYDTELAAAVFERVPKIARAIKASNPAIKGMNFLNNNGKVAYQSVFHSHIHLIPRYSDQDDFGMHFGDHSAQYDNSKLEEVAAKIRTQLEA